MPVNELNQAIYNKLASGTALTAQLGGTNVYHMQAPDDQDLPFVVWNWQGGGQTDNHDMVSGVEYVRAYASSAAQAGSIYASFDALLNMGSINVTGWTNVTTRREDDIETVEILPNNETVYVVGGLYRVILDR